MSHTSTTATMPATPAVLPTTLRWRSWPLVDHRRWSWGVPLGILTIGAAATHFGSALMGTIAVLSLTATLWQFFLPVAYEVDSLGLRRRALGRTRVIAWHTVRAYQARATGIVLFERPDATAIDSLCSIFVPYAADEDETLCVVRQYLPHAVEM